MTDPSRTRRGVLGIVCVSLAGAVAGCEVDAMGGSPTPTPDPFDALRQERVYVAQSLTITTPEGVDEAASPDDADVIVLPATHDRDAGVLVEWLQAGRYVVFLGPDSQSAYHELRGSQAYAAAYGRPGVRAESCASSGSGGGGSGSDGASPTDCEPPELILVWEAAEGHVTSHRTTWGGTDEPSDRRIFTAIDDALEG